MAKDIRLQHSLSERQTNLRTVNNATRKDEENDGVSKPALI